MTAGVSLFQSTLPARGATGGDAGQHRHRHFNPRSPHGERRGAAQSCVPQRKISIHAPRTGSDHRGGQPHGANAPFQSTLPARGATIVASYRALGFEFQSTLPARGATSGSTQRTSEFSFQSTLPARGATSGARRQDLCQHDFNPRSPHGERLCAKRQSRHAFWISIHAPRTGSDGRGGGRHPRLAGISIHAPRTGSDMSCKTQKIRKREISIHAPRTGSDRADDLGR